LGEQFHRDGRALALATGQPRDLGVLMSVQLQIGDDARDLTLAGRLRVVAGQPEFGGVAECPADAQLTVDHVVLGHDPNQLPKARKVAIQVLALVDDLAFGGRLRAGDRTQQRRLAGAGRSDHRHQIAGRHRETDVAQQALAVLECEGQVVGDQGAAERFVRADNLVAGQPEHGASDGEPVSWRESGSTHDVPAIELGAVEAAEVGDSVAAGGGREACVIAGDQRIVQDNSVVRRATDRDVDAESCLISIDKHGVARRRTGLVVLVGGLRRGDPLTRGPVELDGQLVAVGVAQPEGDVIENPAG